MTMAQAYQTYGNYENEYGRGYVPPGRLYVHSSVYLPNSEIDPCTGLLKPDVRRQGRIQAKRLEYASLEREYKELEVQRRQVETKPGFRISIQTAILSVAIFAFVLGILYLSQQGTLAERQKDYNIVCQDVDSYQKANNEISARIAEASDATVICYAAARDLNMIPAESAQAIHLVAMDTRPTQTSTVTRVADSEGAVQSGEAQLDVEATTVPVVASAGAEN